MHRAGIYAIVHVLSGWRYLGQTNSFKRRWEQHREALISRHHHNQRLQEAWDLDGELAFDFVELEVAPAYLQPVQLQEWLLQREHDLIQTYKTIGLAFNIVDAELVVTHAAVQAANTPNVALSAGIHKQLNALKPRITEAEALVREKIKDLNEARAKFAAAERHQSNSIGIFRSLFGRRDGPESLENERQVQAAAAAVSAASEELSKASASLEAMIADRKALNNSYPGNVRRAAARRRARGMF